LNGKGRGGDTELVNTTNSVIKQFVEVTNMLGRP